MQKKVGFILFPLPPTIKESRIEILGMRTGRGRGDLARCLDRVVDVYTRSMVGIRPATQTSVYRLFNGQYVVYSYLDVPCVERCA